jgi:hypothetical protein
LGAAVMPTTQEKRIIYEYEIPPNP